MSIKFETKASRSMFGKLDGKFVCSIPGNGTRYWVTQNNHNTNWHVSDDCGAAWGNFKTSSEAIKAVENL